MRKQAPSGTGDRRPAIGAQIVSLPSLLIHPALERKDRLLSSLCLSPLSIHLIRLPSERKDGRRRRMLHTSSIFL